MLRYVREISRRESPHPFGGVRVDLHTVEYRLSQTPLRLLHSWELPKSHEREEWETEEDLWFRKDNQIYNVKEFCTVGMPRLPGPHGGAQLASDGYFCIAAYEGNLHTVNIKETIPFGMRR